ncbi:Do family serine endopeptidase [Pseudoroseomonas wenyumeiae]|uniref:Probable periplasmic serine endoprotease DegP-like n=1 Tax=Teichococcus wenyumeiae TaxID=2478470 RepID=A0A3A9JTE3_9PROT|nr:DegQ family serine endoprotease [Pseudoroseomonas wenyumeiae]RKK03988.1 DegQ family serine endoprotease [Pseudoroseomonas wenyumeiae]RMI19386.1 Do family serine endopeptidase [Pseudoroseomonas wenyumeiae]RMI20303.1 Do family serine endopeptidase [Pseudoroseomonas wenyumeiae]
MRLAPMMLAAAVAAAPLTAPLSAWAQATMTAPNVTPPGTTSPAPQTFPAPPSFAPLARQLLPAVVNVQTSQTIGGPRAGRPDAPEIPQVPPGSPFEELFRDFLERQRPGQRPGQPPRRAQSQGSGFIIDASGIIVTNNHVVDGADEINVVLQDNTTLKAELVGVDARTDLAVLRVKTDKQLPTVPFGDSDKAEVGDWVLAIGNPLGFGGSVTSGIVSARGRNINAGPYDDFIQTDAAINRGNSGGPLFNMQGEVIGINTAIVSPSGGSIGIGFSIPSNLAKNIVAQLRDGGRVKRGWMGVNIQQVTDEIAESLNVPGGARGALVARADENGPAAKAGVRNGDVILRFNNQDVKEMRSLPRIVAETPVGTEVPMTVWRNGKEEQLKVTVAELPTDQQASTSAAPEQTRPGSALELSGLGLKVSPITPEAKERFSLRDEAKGVVVTEVAPGSSAAERGITPGDLIVEVQQNRVSTPQEVREQLERLRKQNRPSALLLIENGQGQRFVPLRLRPESGSPG